MAKEKIEEVEELEEEEVPEEDLLEDFDPEGETKKTPEEETAEAFEKINVRQNRIIQAVSANQKYIKKNFQEIKTLTENFKILLDK